tara:strand:+ start:326 stop:622 length:297 start_codon:yes stop_codon:yes gene_type:complete
MTAIADIARKYRRAIRNETGTSFSFAELQAIVEVGGFDAVVRAELDELRAKCQTEKSSNIRDIGSASEGMEPPPTSGRSPDTRPPLDQFSIEALERAA